MADSKDYQKAMDELELESTSKKDELKTNMWDMMCLFGGGTGV